VCALTTAYNKLTFGLDILSTNLVVTIITIIIIIIIIVLLLLTPVLNSQGMKKLRCAIQKSTKIKLE